MPLTPREAAVVRFEAGSRTDYIKGSRKAYFEAIGIPEQSYYQILKRPHVERAIEDWVKRIEVDHDYAAIMLRLNAMVQLDALIRDKKASNRDRLTAIGKQLDATDHVEDKRTDTPYESLPDQDLWDEVTKRRERLGLTEEEFLKERLQ